MAIMVLDPTAVSPVVEHGLDRLLGESTTG
jgi:hypothetical protein